MHLTAFLVEDSAIIRDSLVPTLADLAGTVVVGYAESEMEALDWLKANATWDLAIVDIFLRHGSGLGVLGALRGRDCRQRAVVLTNYPTDEIRRRCQILGADAVFDKSTELEQLMTFCRAAARMRENP